MKNPFLTQLMSRKSKSTPIEDKGFDRLPFERVVRELAQAEGHPDLRFTKKAMDALQQGSESFMEDLFAAADVHAEATGRSTVMPRDLGLVLGEVAQCNLRWTPIAFPEQSQKE